MKKIIEQVAAVHARLPANFDKAILGMALQPKDESDASVSGKDCYAWYYALGKVLMPLDLCEIGPRYGYALLAMVKGAIHAGRKPVGVIAFDNECDEPGCLAIAKDNLLPYVKEDPQMIRANTQNLGSLSPQYAANYSFDLIHVDGDQSFDGVTHDLELAWEVVQPGGVILLPDVLLAEVSEAGRKFAERNGLVAHRLPTHRRLDVFQKPI